MKYHGKNPLGLAIAVDKSGAVCDDVLRTLRDYLATAEQQISVSSIPATYQRHLAAMECAAACSEVVKEFYAVCVSTSAEHVG